MPDSKITALTAITTVNPATFPLVIVDTSDTSMATTGTTKKVTTNQLLGSGGTATLASATITGALTVQGVGGISIGSASFTSGRALAATSPAGSAVGIRLLQSATSDWEITNVATAGNLSITQSGANLLSLTGAGVFTFGDGAGGTRMTLNSTGLGVGAVPSGNNQLTVRSSGAGTEMTVSLGRTSQEGLIGIAAATNGFVTGSIAGDMVVRSNGKLMLFNNSANAGITIDTSANVGIGVTPSAWGAGNKAIQVSTGAAFWGDAANAYINSNSFYNGTNFIYLTNAAANRYAAGGGVHYWYTAPSGTAGNAITFTQAMTLDASGNLLVGTTTSLANTSHSFQATGTTNSFWAGTFQHNGTANNGRVLNWKLTNANDTGSYFVFANNSGGNCFNVLGNGNVQNTTGTYGTISDLRLKENISDARNYLADLLKLRVVKYSLKSESSPTANLIGLIAQEVEQVFPTLVETNGDDVKSIKTTVLIPMLLKALQELTARVQTLETR